MFSFKTILVKKVLQQIILHHLNIVNLINLIIQNLDSTYM